MFHLCQLLFIFNSCFQYCLFSNLSILYCNSNCSLTVSCNKVYGDDDNDDDDDDDDDDDVFR